MKNDKLITVSEYAAIQNCTTAAVYKRLNTSLQKYVVQDKTVENAKKPQFKLNYTAMVRDGLITVDKKVDENDTTVDNTKNMRRYVEMLENQLRVKDEQIKALQEQNTSLTQALENVTRIADQSQQLQGHQQKMLENERTEKSKTKQSWFSRLFNATPNAEYAAEPTTSEGTEQKH